MKEECVAAWDQYCRKLGKFSVTDVIPAQLFLDAFVYGYRCGMRETGKEIGRHQKCN